MYDLDVFHDLVKPDAVNKSQRRICSPIHIEFMTKVAYQIAATDLVAFVILDVINGGYELYRIHKEPIRSRTDYFNVDAIYDIACLGEFRRTGKEETSLHMLGDMVRHIAEQAQHTYECQLQMIQRLYLRWVWDKRTPNALKSNRMFVLETYGVSPSFNIDAFKIPKTSFFKTPFVSQIYGDFHVTDIPSPRQIFKLHNYLCENRGKVGLLIGEHDGHPERVITTDRFNGETPYSILMRLGSIGKISFKISPEMTKALKTFPVFPGESLFIYIAKLFRSNQDITIPILMWRIYTNQPAIPVSDFELSLESMPSFEYQ